MRYWERAKETVRASGTWPMMGLSVSSTFRRLDDSQHPMVPTMSVPQCGGGPRRSTGQATRLGLESSEKVWLHLIADGVGLCSQFFSTDRRPISPQNNSQGILFTRATDATSFPRLGSLSLTHSRKNSKSNRMWRRYMAQQSKVFVLFVFALLCFFAWMCSADCPIQEDASSMDVGKTGIRLASEKR